MTATTSIRRAYVKFVHQHSLVTPFEKYNINEIRTALIANKVPTAASISSNTPKANTNIAYATSKNEIDRSSESTDDDSSLSSLSTLSSISTMRHEEEIAKINERNRKYKEMDRKLDAIIDHFIGLK